jgi:predicted nucleotide-binding protein (sugar kinase/HSP70/actin superfamily)
MKVSFPHLGQLYIALKAMFDSVNVETIIPPFSTRRTMSLATQYSPEGLCLPYKLTLGNMIEAAETGADTLITIGGFNTCRMGYYHKLQESILNDLGYHPEIIAIGLDNNKFGGFIGMLKYLSNNSNMAKIISAFWFGMKKMTVLDDFEILMNDIRPIEKIAGSTGKLYRKAVKAVDDASSFSSLRRVSREYKNEFRNLPINKELRPLRILVVGEIYVVLDPFSNLDVEFELAKLGAATRRSLYISRWAKWSLFLNPLGIDQWKEVHKAATPYLKRDIGGDGWETVGEKITGARHHFDGMVHLCPFTCMPETMAQNIMAQMKEGLPVLSLSLDEQTSKTGMITRLEAFVDMIKRKQSNLLVSRYKENESIPGN